MNFKIGICIDCGPGSIEKPLTAGRCHNHYWKYRANLKLSAKKQLDGYEDKQAQKKALDLWFAKQIRQMPRCCENCGERLIIFAPWAAKAYIAHILPKRLFKSVIIHPDNRLFLCLICHENFDRWPAEKVITMPVFPLAVERFMLLQHNLNKDEINDLPVYFAKLIAA
jgi:hypothetical protein